MRSEGANVRRRESLRASGTVLGLAAILPLADASTAHATANGPDPDQLFQDGRFAAADRGYARLLEKDPGDAHAWAQRGYIALLSNRFGDTEQFLGQATPCRCRGSRTATCGRMTSPGRSRCCGNQATG
jgi:Flp pilus assembly protein TadD